ncbi:MAG: glycosyltransferase family 4 protein [Candidatus Margulisbacteria bacterium]|jgi:glycosyltransferase involved in cell wall biosynthesis|nr:glycosyltransferase family 4 protein [Candidatus Margulisiibacteriota bacterium]
MQIAIDCRMLGKSGIGIFTKNLLENLPDKHEYILIGEKARLLKYTRPANIINFTAPIFSLQEMLAYPAAAVNKCGAFFTPNWNIPAGIRVPIYAMIHDVVFLDLPELTSFRGRLIRRALLWRAVKLSRHIFTVSEFSRRRIIHFFQNSAKISVIYNDVSAEVKNFARQKKPKAGDYYLYVGNIKKHKGLGTLIAAYTGLRTTAKLIIVGAKENFRTRDEDIININNPNIVFTGFVSEQKLLELLGQAKALIQPSLYEGFGLPPLEALWLKTPVILSDIPVFKEIYADLPVTFFKTGDSLDLAEKLCDIKPCKYTPQNLLKKYDAAWIAGTIFAKIQDTAGKA